MPSNRNRSPPQGKMPNMTHSASIASGSACLPQVSDSDEAEHSTDHGSIAQRMGRFSRWALAALACLWLALCTAVGPIYWADSSIASWSWFQTLTLLGSFAVYFSMVCALVRFGRGQRIIPLTWLRTTRASLASRLQASSQANSQVSKICLAIRRFFTSRLWVGMKTACSRILIQATNRRWKIALILCVGWIWIPTTLLSAYGADIRSQMREFSWAWNQWTGVHQPYIGFFSFVPMDIYPTAHYLWPESSTYLTDQHNIVLTIVHGAVAAASRYLTGSNDWGLVTLSAMQWLFAILCCSATLHRFLNLPWLRREAVFATPSPFGQPEYSQALELIDPTHPERGYRPLTLECRTKKNGSALLPAGPIFRFAFLPFFLFCPLVVFSTISLTKSPLFAFAFVWWFGIGYELHMTSGLHLGTKRGLRKRSFIAMLIATCIMLISAKYAWYILVFQLVLFLIADRKRWYVYVITALLPVIVIHGGIALMINNGSIISGDPIESRGIQLQQIARIAKRNPSAISSSAKARLSAVFNLDQMAEAYYPQDADPVKSSGIQSKKVSYRWRSATPEDLEAFNKAWLEIIKADPVTATDAFLAKCFGYFNVFDQPYVAMNYYVSNDYVQQSSTWIKYQFHDWRNTISEDAQQWGEIPVLGWVTHGNFYVTLTLIFGAAEVILRRWRTLVWHMPLLLLMGVMITAPANNFERHMLPVAFVFGCMALTFWRESRPRAACSKAAL